MSGGVCVGGLAMGSLPTKSSAAGGPPEITLQRADVSLTAFAVEEELSSAF